MDTDERYSDDVEGYDPADIAPLQQRAVGGASLWIDELDQHLCSGSV